MYCFRYYLIVFLAIAGGSRIVSANADSLARVDLPGLIRQGSERNPSIKAALIEWQATVAKLPQAFALPDPKLRLDYYVDSVETRVGPQQYRIGLSQRFPFPGTLAQAGEVVTRDIRIRHAEYDKAIRDFIVDLTVSYNELVYLRGAAKITRQNQELLEHVLKVATTRHAEGKAKFIDVLKAQSQLAQLSYDLILLRELEQVEIVQINALLDHPSERPLGELRTPQLPVLQTSLPEIEAVALGQRQEIEIAAAEVDKAAESVRLAELKNRPSLTVNSTHVLTGDAAGNVADSGKDAWMVGVGISLPVWRSRNRSRVEEAELRHASAVQQQRKVENETRAALRTVYFRLENARRLIELYEKSLIPQAAQAMEVAEQWHDTGVNDIAGFLETQGVWFNFNLARLRAVTDYQQYLVRLEQLAGGLVPESSVTPEAQP